MPEAVIVAAARTPIARAYKGSLVGVDAFKLAEIAVDAAISRSGIPTGVVSIPLRYMHSPVEMVDLRDVEATVELLAAFGRRLSGDWDLSR